MDVEKLPISSSFPGKPMDLSYVSLPEGTIDIHIAT